MTSAGLVVKLWRLVVGFVSRSPLKRCQLYNYAIIGEVTSLSGAVGRSSYGYWEDSNAVWRSPMYVEA